MAFLFLIFGPMLAAGLLWLCARKKEALAWPIAFGMTAAELLVSLAFALGPDAARELPFLNGLGLRFALDGFRRVYIVLVAFMWMMTAALGREYFHGHGKLTRYWSFTLMTLGATMGVFLAGDLYSAFVFFEIMSFTSFVWVIQEENAGAIRAAGTYLAVAVIGGLTALMGLFLLQHECGTLELSALYGALQRAEHPAVIYTAGGCILFGFGAKAGMFPLHIWLPKAHPVAPAPASALLSGVLTKSGIWGVIALTGYVFHDDPHWGAVILALGCVTMLLGAVLALFSVDLKRTLACSSLSQIGFILVGLGMMGLLGEEGALAARGTLLHMLNHSLFKLVLFMCAGVVYRNTHTLDLTRLRGFGRGKPFLTVCFLLAAAGIAGVPGLNGYISKTLLHESIVEGQAHFGAGLAAAEWIFLLSGGLTLAYMTKLFVCIFVEKPAEENGNVPAQASFGENVPAHTSCGGDSSVSPSFGRNIPAHPALSGNIPVRASYIRPLGVFALGASALLLPVLGLTAPLTMDALATLGTDFFRAPELEHAVHYYSLENLKGAVISIGIGAAVYAGAVRKGMIRNGRYVDLWPARLDLEEALYRPLLLKWLPAALGGISALFAENRISAWLFRSIKRGLTLLAGLFAENRISAALYRGTKRLLTRASVFFAENRFSGALYRNVKRAAELASHFFSDTLDAFVLLLHRTVFRPLPVPETDKARLSLAYRLGALADRARARRSRRALPSPETSDDPAASDRMARSAYLTTRTLRRTTHELADSLSFALLLMAGAVCAVLIYVLIVKG